MSTENPDSQSKEVCNEKHKRVDEKMDCYESDIKTIKRSINATLIFTIITLSSFIIWMVQNKVYPG